jgi:hypothetical protein
MMMIYLTELKFGDVNVKNPSAKRTIVSVTSGIRSVLQAVDARIVKIRRDSLINLEKRKKLKPS